MKRAIVGLALFFFCIAPFQNAWAKSDLGFNRLGVDLGIVDPEAGGSTLGLGVVAELGTLGRNVALSSQLGYWSESEGAFGTEATVRDISIGARVKYLFPVSSSKFQPYAGGGLGLHFFHSEVVVPDMDMGGFVVPGFTAEDSATKLGFDLGGGTSMPLSPKTNLYGELWYTVADIDQLSMKVGVSFLLNK